MSYIITLIIVWFFALILLLGFLALIRYIQYREHVALLSHGMRPEDLPRHSRNHHILRAGLITSLVGLALTIGLYPLGFLLPPIFTTAPLHLGPWLLPGLIPLGVGMALIISYYLEPTTQPAESTTDKSNSDQNNIIPLARKEPSERPYTPPDAKDSQR